MNATIAATETVYRIHPIEDPRWGAFVRRHPRSSIFHTAAWLEALRKTYGYEPVAITTSSPGEELRDGIVFCRVKSWVTGHRLVSLPFSDHCEPLVDDPANLNAMLAALKPESLKDKSQYVELRPLSALNHVPSQFIPSQTFCFHQVDLTPGLDTLFGNCHKDSTQRKIRRAEREGLVYEEGRSQNLLDNFYRLLMLTRRRHQVPPQPKSWFETLIACCGESLKIRVASKDGQPTAAILTLHHKDTLTYKYGCSDARFSNLGGMHLLFWRSIQEAKAAGLRTFDLGRSDTDNQGLITFKDRWGSAPSELTYSRCSAAQTSQRTLAKKTGTDWKERLTKSMFTHMPDRLLHSVGSLLYKHVG